MTPMREQKEGTAEESIHSDEEYMDTISSVESLTYECKRCNTHIADEEDKQNNSKNWGPFDLYRNINIPAGYSASFDNAINCEEGPVTKVNCESVSYNICYVYCKGCNRELGRKYTPWSAFYGPNKEGRRGTFVLKQDRLQIGDHSA